METRIITTGFDFLEDLRAGKVHVVAFAHLGFSPLHACACMGCDLPGQDADAFVHSVNQRDEVGTLFPRMTISALPKRFGRTDEDYFRAFSYEEYARVIKDALECNEKAVKSPTLIFELSCALISQRPFLERVFAELEGRTTTHTKTVIGIVDEQKSFTYHPESESL